MTRVVGSLAQAVVTAGVLAALAAMQPVANASPNQFAQAAPAAAAPAEPARTVPSQPAQPAPRSHRAEPTRRQRVEIMISDLHKKLGITAAEQSQFNAVAEVMRANARTMESLLVERTRDSNRSAVASVRWYERLTEAHAAALKNFIPPFETLYAALSESQRKAADSIFLQISERPVMPRSR